MIDEQASRVKDDGFITQLLIMTMPNDDITQPISGFAGYIAEGHVPDDCS